MPTPKMPRVTRITPEMVIEAYHKIDATPIQGYTYIHLNGQDEPPCVCGLGAIVLASEVSNRIDLGFGVIEPMLKVMGYDPEVLAMSTPQALYLSGFMVGFDAPISDTPEGADSYHEGYADAPYLVGKIDGTKAWLAVKVMVANSEA